MVDKKRSEVQKNRLNTDILLYTELNAACERLTYLLFAHSLSLWTIIFLCVIKKVLSAKVTKQAVSLDS